jgi:hypothetical protein
MFSMGAKVHEDGALSTALDQVQGSRKWLLDMAGGRAETRRISMSNPGATKRFLTHP